ncbi:helix-turn-helix transcriptional regulator [Paenibacillus sp. OV219]|uniref:helix-turn-helix transcriptional regulator n=1 Tax=Paenibacillus sp. OV219 TaxID=1884377 RepID=UPI0008C4CADD|nr:AraC family transcriptional regulator [Paenibacillus sp. OV219]SEN86778.1 Helix-turn-helix domain-containing protein [Paenibacillus sp. OV219]
MQILPKSIVPAASDQKELEALRNSIMYSVVERMLHKQEGSITLFYQSLLATHIVEEALAYIDVHFGKDFGLTQVTDEMHCSSTYLNRLLKQHTGHTFYSLLTQKRIERSKQLLMMDSQTVLAISGEVGYTNVHSFIRAFKRSVGITPGQYRDSSMTACR